MKQITLSSSFWIVLTLLLLACTETPPAPNTETAPLTDDIVLEIERDGMVQITLASLTERGADITAFTPETVSLTTAGRPVPYHLIDEQTLLFYGQGSTNRYTATRPYLLTFGEAGTTMRQTAVSPRPDAPSHDTVEQTLTLEENNLYHSQAREDDESDVWFWQLINQQERFPVELNLPTATSAEAQLRLQLRGFTQNRDVDNDHDLDLVLNDQTLTTVRFDGETVHDERVTVPASTLRPGSNTLLLDNSAEGASFLDIVHLNWVELTYRSQPEAINDRLQFRSAAGNVTLSGFSATPQIFDITNPSEPALLTEWMENSGQLTLFAENDQTLMAVGPRGYQPPASIRPFSAGNWQATDNAADLLIITTSELAPALAPLVEAREAEGITTAVVPVSEIYDGFGFGEASPSHITSFVAHAVNSWQTAPTYLFIVGDATSDYRNYLGVAPANVIPSPMVPVIFSGETVSDSRLADIDGDLAPDLAVGRWPVSTPEQVSSLVERTLAYEAGTAVNQTLFAADGTESQFEVFAQRLRDNGDLDSSQATILNGASADAVASSINQGAWLTTYVGHGSVTQWGKEDVFTLEAVASLSGDTPPPIVLQLTCLTGLFAHPEQISIAETLLTNDAGPVLQVAATSLTLSTHQEPFATTLIQQLQAEEITRIGDAFQIAKQGLDVQNPGSREIVDTFVLIGDPSASIVRPNS